MDTLVSVCTFLYHVLYPKLGWGQRGIETFINAIIINKGQGRRRCDVVLRYHYTDDVNSRPTMDSERPESNTNMVRDGRHKATVWKCHYTADDVKTKSMTMDSERPESSANMVRDGRHKATDWKCHYTDDVKSRPSMDS